jgi:hypothetical protein
MAVPSHVVGDVEVACALAIPLSSIFSIYVHQENVRLDYERLLGLRKDPKTLIDPKT